MSIIKYKDGDQWASILTVKGDQGEPGPQGDPGPQGPAGPQGPPGGVNDVTINGTSIVGAGGVAEVPLAANGDIDSRDVQKIVTSGALDYAVKAALCDGQGPAYSAAEQAAARARLGTQEIFWVTYQVTTWQQVKDALDAGKFPVVKEGGKYYAYAGTDDPQIQSRHRFTSSWKSNEQWYLVLLDTDVWSGGSFAAANGNDLIHSTDAWASNDTKYPTTAAADARYEFKGQGGGGTNNILVGDTSFETVTNFLDQAVSFEDPKPLGTIFNYDGWLDNYTNDAWAGDKGILAWTYAGTKSFSGTINDQYSYYSAHFFWADALYAEGEPSGSEGSSLSVMGMTKLLAMCVYDNTNGYYYGWYPNWSWS